MVSCCNFSTAPVEEKATGNCAHQVGAAIAAYGAGLTRTVEGTYAPAFISSGVLCLVAGLLCLLIGRPLAADKAPTATEPAATAAA